MKEHKSLSSDHHLEPPSECSCDGGYRHDEEGKHPCDSCNPQSMRFRLNSRKVQKRCQEAFEKTCAEARRKKEAELPEWASAIDNDTNYIESQESDK